MTRPRGEQSCSATSRSRGIGSTRTRSAPAGAPDASSAPGPARTTWRSAWRAQNARPLLVRAGVDEDHVRVLALGTVEHRSPDPRGVVGRRATRRIRSARAPPASSRSQGSGVDAGPERADGEDRRPRRRTIEPAARLELQRQRRSRVRSRNPASCSRSVEKPRVQLESSLSRTASTVADRGLPVRSASSPRTCSRSELPHHRRPVLAVDEHAQASAAHDVEPVCGLPLADDDLACLGRGRAAGAGRARRASRRRAREHRHARDSRSDRSVLDPAKRPERSSSRSRPGNVSHRRPRR